MGITHVEGDVDPIRDLDIINEELRLKDVEYFEKIFDECERMYVRGGDKKRKGEYEILCKIKKVLIEETRMIRYGDWNQADIETLNKHLFITAKSMIYLVNLSEKDFLRKKNKWLPKIKEYIDKNDPGATVIPFSGTFEQKLMDFETDDETKCTSILDKIVVQGYKALQLQYFFTAGEDEVKAWTIQRGSTAPQAAGRIHTDFEKGFIMAEVMKFAAFKAAGGYRQQGKNYIVEDGDIIFFKFNAGAGHGWEEGREKEVKKGSSKL